MFERDASIAIDKIRLHNANRDPRLVARKYDRMAESAFSFFRGTCHLFYDDWRQAWPEEKGPNHWIVGDLHLENFGAFTTLARNVRYDINDFDEATIGPPVLDIGRFLTSIYVASRDLGLSGRDYVVFGVTLLEHYCQGLLAAARSGSERVFDEKNADGPIADLLKEAEKDTRIHILIDRTEVTPGGRRLKRNPKSFDVPPETKRIIEEALKAYEQDVHPRHSFKLLDVTFRVAGTGSLGIRRYAALVEGKGGSDGQLILDIKEALPSSLHPFLDAPLTAYSHEAERVVRAQRAMQGDSPAYLGWTQIGGRWFIVRELQPSKDKLIITAGDPKALPQRIHSVVKAAARIMSWAHARAALESSQVSSTELMKFAESGDVKRPGSWAGQLLLLAAAYTDRVVQDHLAWKKNQVGFGL
jgi:uncharacterized protein (DUF2252 family)